MNVIERLEGLAEKNAEFWCYADLVEIGNALPDLVKLARAARVIAPFIGCTDPPRLGYSEQGVMQYGRCGKCSHCKFRAAVDAVHAEVKP
jgi:hypothetical protein